MIEGSLLESAVAPRCGPQTSGASPQPHSGSACSLSTAAGGVRETRRAIAAVQGELSAGPWARKDYGSEGPRTIRCDKRVDSHPREGAAGDLSDLPGSSVGDAPSVRRPQDQRRADRAAGRGRCWQPRPPGGSSSAHMRLNAGLARTSAIARLLGPVADGLDVVAVRVAHEG